MRMKSFVVFRARSTSIEEEKMAPDLASLSKSISEPLTVVEEQIQSLVMRGLLKPKEEVGSRPS